MRYILHEMPGGSVEGFVVSRANTGEYLFSDS